MKALTKIYWLRFALGLTAALICILYGFATGAISTNLVQNSSVETGTDTPQYWVSSGNVVNWSTTYFRTGSRSIRINVTDASAEWRGKVRQIQEGQTYQVYGFFRGEITKAQFSLNITWFSDLDWSIRLSENSISIPVGNYSHWIPIAGEFTAPQGARSCEIVFGVVNGTGDLYGDDFEVRQTESMMKLTTGIAIAVMVYLISYYAIKFKFMSQVEKSRKLFTTGIGIYFLSWLVFWILFYTLIGAYL